MQIVAKQLYRKLSFYLIFSNSLSVVTQVDVHMAEMYVKTKQLVNVM